MKKFGHKPRQLIPALLYKQTSPATFICCGPTHFIVVVQISEVKSLEQSCK